MAIVIVEVRKVVRYEGVSFGTYIGMFVFKPVVDFALEEVVFAFDPMDEALTLIVTSGCLCDAFVIVGIKKCRKKFLAVFFGLFIAFVTTRFVRLYIFRWLFSVEGSSGFFM